MKTLQLGRLQPLRDLLLEIGNADREVDGWLFLPKEARLTLECPAVLLELNDVAPGTEYEEEEELATPDLAKNHRLKRFLLGADVQDVIINTKSQKPDATLDEIFIAIMHYHNFDAFKDMST